MPFQNIKPLHILWQDTLEIGILDGIVSGIDCILASAGVSKKIKLEYLGKRRQPDWLSQNGTILNPYQSLDWHIELARKNSKQAGYLNSIVLIDSFLDNPTYKTEPRYELVVVSEPLHSGNISRIFGVGRRGQGAIISLDSHLYLLQPVAEETDENKKNRQFNFWLGTKLNTIHELGHAFGLFPGIGVENPTEEQREKAHCPNECVMYWRENDDLYKKIADEPFCPSCREKLKEYFAKRP